MRWVLIVLAVLGIAVSALALREHYRTDASPCSINDRWDCGIVNHSPYAMLHGVPVAVIGIAGYLLLGVLACWKSVPVDAAVGDGRLRVCGPPGGCRSHGAGRLVYLLRHIAGSHYSDDPAGDRQSDRRFDAAGRRQSYS